MTTPPFRQVETLYSQSVVRKHGPALWVNTRSPEYPVLIDYFQGGNYHVRNSGFRTTIRPWRNQGYVVNAANIRRTFRIPDLVYEDAPGGDGIVDILFRVYLGDEDELRDITRQVGSIDELRDYIFSHNINEFPAITNRISRMVREFRETEETVGGEVEAEPESVRSLQDRIEVIVRDHASNTQYADRATLMRDLNLEYMVNRINAIAPDYLKFLGLELRSISVDLRPYQGIERLLAERFERAMRAETEKYEMEQRALGEIALVAAKKQQLQAYLDAGVSSEQIGEIERMSKIGGSAVIIGR